MASIYKRGDRWRVQVYSKLGMKSATFDTKKEAREWGIQLEELGRRRLLPGAEAERTTLAEALKRYRNEVTPTKKGAKVEGYRIGKWLRDPLTRLALTEIRSFDIAQWRDKKLAAGASASSIKNELQVISHCFRIAATEWGMDGITNPVRGVRMPRQKPGRDRRLEPGEYERLKLACQEDPNPWVEAVMDLALETGMRLSEILGLRRRQIKGSVAMLEETDTKTGRARSVPLSSKARAVIASLPASLDGRVVPSNKHTIEHAWVRVCRCATVVDLHIHDLRHEATSRFFERGLDMMQVASITGHRSLSMLQRYTHLRAADLVTLLD